MDAPEERYYNDELQEQASVELPHDPPVSWVAKEHIHPDKGVWWFVAFSFIVLSLIAVDVFFLQSWTFSVLVVVMAVSIMVYVQRPPRDISYTLSPKEGLYSNEKLYPFDDFVSFGIVQDPDEQFIMLVPRRRFSPGVSVYFNDEEAERIVDILGHQLPMEEIKLDPIDILVRKLRL